MTKNIITIIMTYSGYSDRFKLLYALDEFVDRHIIITRDSVDLPPGIQNTIVVHMNRKLRGIGFLLWATKVALQTIRDSDPKEMWLVNEHFTGFVSLLLKIGLGRRVKTVVFLYMSNLTFLFHRGWSADRLAGRLSLRQHWFYFRRWVGFTIQDIISILTTDCMIVNSDMISMDIKKISPHKFVKVLPTSVSTGTTVQQKQEYRETSGRETFQILYVGILQPHKGLGLLLNVFRRYLDQEPNARLTLIGRQFAPDRDWVERLIWKYDLQHHIRLIDHVPQVEVQRHYQEADVFVFPSFYEGSPRVVKEALAWGLPVIASDIPGIRLIDPVGRAISFFSPGDANSLMHHLMRLASSPTERHRIGECSRVLVQEFSHSRVAHRLSDVYTQLWSG